MRDKPNNNGMEKDGFERIYGTLTNTDYHEMPKEIREN
jgi:hypothetical protein